MNKEKLTSQQFILVLHGASCSGKSTVSDIIFKKYGNIFRGKSDTVKRMLSDYDNTLHHDAVALMTLAAMRVAIDHGFSIIKEGGLYGLEEMAQMSKETNVPLFIVNMEAPWEVLLERFQYRVRTPIPGVKINTDVKKFKEIYDTYLSTKIESPLTFDSSKQTPEEIVAIITNHIRSNI